MKFFPIVTASVEGMASRQVATLRSKYICFICLGFNPPLNSGAVAEPYRM